MDLALKLLAVVCMGAVELWAAVPAGLAMGLHPVLATSATSIGAMLGIIAIVMVGERVRSWLLRQFGGKGDGGRLGVARRIWERYGVVGLGLLGPLLLGAPLATAVVGLSVGTPGRRLVLWVGLGSVLWSALLALAVSLGAEGLGRLLAAREP